MFSPIEDILADLRAGKMVILTDDEERENEGDLVLAAQHVTPEAITFMLSVARGYMCLSLTEEDCDRLDLPPQAQTNTSVRGTAFTVSIDGHPRHGFTTGVSAKERARCILMAIDGAYSAADFVRPGHINPLRSRTGGVLVRTGQTEGSLDLCRLGGLKAAAVIIEIMRDDGEMARVPDLVKVAERHGLKMCSVAQIIQHRLARESLVRRVTPARGTEVMTSEGPFRLVAFESVVDALPHVALTLGGVGELDAQGRVIETEKPTLVRMHRRNLLGDVFGVVSEGSGGGVGGGSGGTASGEMLRRAMRAIQKEGRGAIVYLRPEGVAGASGGGGAGASGRESSEALEQRLQVVRRGGLAGASETGGAAGGGGGGGGPESGADVPDLAHPEGHAKSLPESMRDFGVGGQILRGLGLSKLRLMTNSTTELPGLDAFGLSVVERVPLV